MAYSLPRTPWLCVLASARRQFLEQSGRRVQFCSGAASRAWDFGAKLCENSASSKARSSQERLSLKSPWVSALHDLGEKCGGR